jgi:hypothetical protein
MVTSAFGITFPAGSETEPVILPVKTCANPIAATVTTAKHRMNQCLQDIWKASR